MNGFGASLSLTRAWNRAALDSMLAAAGFTAALAESTLRLWSGVMGCPAPLSAAANGARRSELFFSWHTVFAAVGLATLRAWAPPLVHPRERERASACDLEQQSQSVAPTTVFSAYRSDGGHATAQIRVETPVRAAGPCAIDVPAHRRPQTTRTQLH
jgi:hypothetical protein